MAYQVYIEQLRICPLRPKGLLPRVSSRLLEIVRDHGVVEPVVVRKTNESYEILGNAETWMAAQQVRLERVPIHVLEDISDEDATEIAAAAFAGYCADPIDEAEYFRSQVPVNARGRADHRAVAKLAYRTGYARPYISHALRLLRLPIQIQDYVRAGRLSVGHARALLRLNGKSDQVALARRMIAESLSVRQAEQAIRLHVTGSRQLVTQNESGRGQPKIDPDTLCLQQRIGEKLGCVVNIDAAAAALTIHYHQLDILDGVLERLGVATV